MKNTDLKIAEKALIQSLATHVSRLGFLPNPSADQSFYRRVPVGRWALHLSFIRHKTDFDVTADVAVRIDAIEQLVNQFAVGLTEREKSRTFTLGAELGNIAAGQPRRWNISEEQDVPAVAQAVVETFEKTGMPYLARFSDTDSAYRVLASPYPKDWLHCPIVGARCLRAVAAAYLLGQKKELAKLIQQCESLLSKQGDLYLQEFRELSRSLMANS